MRVHIFMQYCKSMKVNKEKNDEIILSTKVPLRRAPPLNTEGMTSLGWAPHLRCTPLFGGHLSLDAQLNESFGIVLLTENFA